MGFLDFCGGAGLKLSLMLADTKAVNQTIKKMITCKKCGNQQEEIIEINAVVKSGGLDFGSDPDSGIGGLCPWSLRK